MGCSEAAAVVADTHRGVCEEGGLPGGGVNEEVFSLQLGGLKQTHWPQIGLTASLKRQVVTARGFWELVLPHLFHEGSRSGLVDHWKTKRQRRPIMGKQL